MPDIKSSRVVIDRLGQFISIHNNTKSKLLLEKTTLKEAAIEPTSAESKKEFAAWAEYMGEQKDEESIRWKKEMIGEGQLQNQKRADDGSVHRMESMLMTNR